MAPSWLADSSTAGSDSAAPAFAVELEAGAGGLAGRWPDTDVRSTTPKANASAAAITMAEFAFKDKRYFAKNRISTNLFWARPRGLSINSDTLLL